MSQQTSWEKDLQKAKMLLAIGIKYSNGKRMVCCLAVLLLILSYSPACLVFSKEDPNQGRQLISSARLSLRGVISKVKVSVDMVACIAFLTVSHLFFSKIRRLLTLEKSFRTSKTSLRNFSTVLMNLTLLWNH